MLHVQSSPFLRLFIPFALGILFYKYYTDSAALAFLLFLVSLLFALIFRFIPFAKKLKFGQFNGIFIHFLLLALGYLIAFSHDVQNHKNWYQNHIAPNSKLRALIESPLKETERTYKATVQINQIYKGTEKISTQGTALVYFKKTGEKPPRHVGDEIVFVNKLNPIISKGNPGEFDYSAFCKNKGIYEQAFLNPSEWKKNKKGDTKQSIFQEWHEAVKKIIATYIPHPAEKGVALALMTGYRDEISKDIYTNYTKTGLVHLLAISGLHMGIFYGGATYLLGLFTFFKRRKKLLIISALCVMWIFALITTFPPSVQRASIMFSFLGIGQIVNRKIPSINFLFASAFLLLLFQPHLLFEVGFQLSYAAVLGILWFFIPIRNWYFPKNKVTTFCWNIMCLSLSAQLFTYPIALYYFHQLPVLFLVTNLIAIPAVTLVIGGEVLLILFSWIEPLAELIGKAVSQLIAWLNAFIDWTASLSFVSIQNIQISLVQCALLLFTMLSLAAWLLAKKKVFAPVGLFLFTACIALGISRKYASLKQEKIIVYNANEPNIEYLLGNKFFTKDTLSEAKRASYQQYIQQPSHLLYGILDTFSLKNAWHQTEHYDLLSLHSKNILRIKKAYKLKAAETPKIDYLIISDPWLKDPSELISSLNPQELIIDGNIPMWKIEDLKTQLEEVDLPTYYVSEQGAKIISL